MKLREQAKKKLKKQGGFTLIEMLIVVAIIAILVAVAIPIVSSALDKTKKATDQANERAAKSVATIQYLQDGKTGKFVFDAVNGKLEAENTTVTEYGQCSTHKGGHIIVEIDASGTLKLTWSNTTTLDGVTATTSST
jgi:type IV pilus assembly protein PilA